MAVHALGGNIFGCPVHTGCLPIDVSQAGVVGERVSRFHERAEWYSRLETSGSRVYDHVLGSVDDWVHLIAH
jgi:hypothetical protein